MKFIQAASFFTSSLSLQKVSAKKAVYKILVNLTTVANFTSILQNLFFCESVVMHCVVVLTIYVRTFGRKKALSKMLVKLTLGTSGEYYFFIGEALYVGSPEDEVSF